MQVDLSFQTHLGHKMPSSWRGQARPGETWLWVDSEHLWILASQEGAQEPLVLVSCWAAAATGDQGTVHETILPRVKPPRISLFPWGPKDSGLWHP